MKKFLLVAIALWSNALTAKQLDVLTAQVAAGNFLYANAGFSKLQDLQLVYTAHATSGTDNYYYIFNAGNHGFAMISADDRVTPVIAYSNETSFDANNIPSNAVGLLENYRTQIAYVIEHNIAATKDIEYRWSSLVSGKETAMKTTAAAAVKPLLTTNWNQMPYYNSMCPVDAGSSEQTVAGCVATATAQVMKYWNYPATGQGSHSYSTAYGTLTADFGATTYDWGAMPASVSADNSAVATLIYQVGVSVNMRYNTAANGGSGAYVTEAQSPVTNCAEYALTNYFKYAATTHGIERSHFSEQQWIDALKDEIANLRPVIYAGFGTAGGHCWVADGYDANDMLHINWGWGGVSNGYFQVSAMNPSALGAGGGSGGFNYNQHAIVGIQPENMTTPDQYENNNSAADAYQFAPVLNSGNTSITTTGSNLHVTNDVDYYYIVLPTGDNYTVKARLQDKTSSNDGNAYTLDAKVATSRNPSLVWSSYSDSTIADQVINGGGVLYFRVAPVNLGDMGTYVLSINVERKTTGINNAAIATSAITLYPNPANSTINITLNGQDADIVLTDIQGRQLQHLAAKNQSSVQVPVANLPNGLYLVQIKSGGLTETHKISVAH